MVFRPLILYYLILNLFSLFSCSLFVAYLPLSSHILGCIKAELLELGDEFKNGSNFLLNFIQIGR